MSNSGALQLLRSDTLQRRRERQSYVQQLGLEPLIFLGVAIVVFFLGIVGAVLFARWVRRNEKKKPTLEQIQRRQEREASAEIIEGYRRTVVAQGWKPKLANAGDAFLVST